MTATAPARKKRSGIPTGHAGEYAVMAELLRQGFDAQLADRNTKGYDLLVGRQADIRLRKVQVKTVRVQPWYVKLADFEGRALSMVTVYVLLGPRDAPGPARFFIARNRSLLEQVIRPPGWEKNGFMPLKALERYERNWKVLGRTETA